MKIIRVANQFEEDPLENIEERNIFEGEQDMIDLQDKGPSNIAEIISAITPSFVERLDANYIANGAEATFEYADGKVYKITIELSKRFPAEPSMIDPNDNLI